MLIKVLFSWLMMASFSFGAEQCVTVDQTGWSQHEKNMMIPTANSLADSAAATHPLAEVNGARVCFDSPNFNLATVITTVTMHARFLANDAIIQANTAAEVQRRADMATEVRNNDACNADMDVLSTRIDNAYAAANTAAEVKQVTATIIKKLVRCVRARANE